jgi:hypothetical protein
VYAELLGPSWLTLPESIRRLHESGTCRHGVGGFRVRGGNALGRLIARIAGMPSAAESVSVSLVVTPQPDGEEWRRKFGDAPLVSIQRMDGDSICERFGAVEVRFRLEATESGLRYLFEGGSIRILGLPVPLPLTASAHERARRGVDSGIDVSVDVAMKGIGRIVAYDGTLVRINVD